MNKRRMKEVISLIMEGKSTKTTIDGYMYTISFPERADRVEMWPVGNGNGAFSDVNRNDYAYTHGGKVYRAAVDLAKELFSMIREVRSANETEDYFAVLTCTAHGTALYRTAEDEDSAKDLIGSLPDRNVNIPPPVRVVDLTREPVDLDNPETWSTDPSWSARYAMNGTYPSDWST